VISIHSKLSKEAENMLRDFYVKLRENSIKEKYPKPTLRFYEKLLRLAEKIAKRNENKTVTEVDALLAITSIFAYSKKGWKPYDRAYYLNKMHEEELKSFKEISDLIGMSVTKVGDY